MDAAPATIAMTTPSKKLTPVLVPGTAARCTLWILGRWAGPKTREVKWSSVCELYYILLLPVSISLLHIIIWPVIIYYYCLLLHCYYIIITHYYIIYDYVLLQFLLSHCYYIIITYYYIIHYYLSLHFLLLHRHYIIITYYNIIHIHYCLLLRITETSLLRIITSLLRHYYVILICYNR